MRPSKEQYRTLFENSQIGIYRTTPDGRILLSNPALIQMLGYSSYEELAGRDLEREGFVEDSARRRFKELVEANGEVKGYESAWKKRDGSLILVSENAKAVHGKDGAILYYDGTVEDITLRRQAEEAQARRAQELKALYETSLAINAQLDLLTLLQTIIEHAARLLGTDMGGLYLTEPDQHTLVLVVSYNLPVEYLGTRLRFGEGLSGQVVATGDAAMLDDYQEWDLRPGIYSESPFRRALAVPLKLKGRIIGVVKVTDSQRTGLFNSDDVRLLSYFADQAVIAIQNARLYDAAQHELADRQRAEVALRRSEERFRAIFDSINDAIIVQDLEDDAILEVNQKMCEMWGYTRREALEVSLGQLSAGEPPFSQNEFLGRVDQARSGAAQLFEWKARHKTGRVFWTEVNMRRATIGELDVVLMAVRDISERKRAEQMQLATYRISDLARTTQTLEELFGAIQSVIGEFMPAENFYIAFYDPATDLIHFPYQADFYDGELTPMPVGKSLTGYVLKTGRPLLAPPEVFDQMVKAGEAELVGIPSVDWLGVPLKNQLGETIGVVAIQTYDEAIRLGERDKDMLVFVSSQVTMVIEQKRIQKALQASELLYRSLVNVLPDGVALSDLDGNILFVSPRLVEMLGGPVLDEGRQVNALEWIAPESQVKGKAYFRAILADESFDDHEFVLLRKDGSHFFGELIGTLLKDENGAPVRVVSVVRDISAHKQAEEALHQSEEKNRRLIETAYDGISLVDEQGNVIEWNSAEERIIGLPKAQAMGRPIWEIQFKSAVGIEKTPEAQEHIRQIILNMLKTGEIPQFGQYMDQSIDRGDGVVRTIQVLNFPIKTNKGYMIGSITRDISEERRAAQALRDSEQRYRSVFEYAPVGIFQSTPEGIYVYVNPELARIYGYESPQELFETVNQANIGSTLYVDPARHDILVNEVIHSDTWKQYENLYRRKDGSVMVARLSLRSARDAQDGKTYLTGFIEDVTERRHAQEAIRLHAARAEALLRVAASLNAQLNLGTLLETVCTEAAHALNAPISWVTLYDEQHTVLRGMESFGLPSDFTKTYRPILRDSFNTFIERYGTLNVVPDVRLVSDLPNCEQLAALDMQAVASCTMVREGQLVGSVVVANWRGARPFTTDELTLLKGIGDQAAQAILNNRLFSDVQRHLQYEQLLHAVDLVITTSNTDLAFSLNIILHQVAAQLKVDAVDVLLLNPERGAFEYKAGCGFVTGAILNTRLEAATLAGELLNLQNRLICFPDLDEASLGPDRTDLVKGEEFASYFGSPLIIKDQARGLLEVFHRSPLDPDREWLDFLGALSTQIAVGIDNIILFEDLQNSNADLERAYDTTLEGWSRALDLRDRETEGHSKRVTEMTVALAQALGISKAELVHIRRGALLHDIGKMGVPDEILRKSNQLTEQDWVIMHKHPEFAYDLLRPVAFLRPALDIPYCHHERWDGKGYPRGLEGEEIPRAARIFAILDVWDALNSDRPYSPAWPEDKVLDYIISQKGKHFDPEVVDAFLCILDTIRQISQSTPRSN